MEKILELLEKLISIDTVSKRSNLELIDFCKLELGRQGIAAEIISNPAGDKANLFATIGPDRPGGILLSGHSDVVPADTGQWKSPPFEMRVDGGRAYGRGTADMKGFIACVLATVPTWKEVALARPVHLAITFDEEIGCRGAPLLIDRLEQRDLRPEAVFVGEPTEMRVVNAHKSLLGVRTQIEGIEAHSSLPHLGVSAVEIAARAINLLRSVGEKAAAVTDKRFTPDHMTISANQICGGTATNILAGHCCFDWDIRAIPDVDAEHWFRAVIASWRDNILNNHRYRNHGVSMRSETQANVPGLAAEKAGAAETLAYRLTHPQEPQAVSYVTEAGLYQKAGYSAIVMGPGSINEAHRADEFVTLEQLRKCQQFLARLAQELSAA